MGVPPRIVTASMKDYTATTLAGRRADAVVWFNSMARAFATSSAFTNAPVPFVESFVKAHPIEAYFGKTWTKLLPESAYLYADDAVGEYPWPKGTNRFPHQLRGTGDTPDADFYAAWEQSPFSDEYLGLFAEEAIDVLKMGQGSGTDYLAISFSALDLAGHDFGPRSHEVQDMLARLDRTLGSLLAHLDRRVGRQNYVLALTSDHGVAPIPEQVAEFGLPGGRVSGAELIARVEKALEPALGPGKKVSSLGYNALYFEPGVFAKLQADPAAMQAALDAVRSFPGVARVFRADDLAHPFADLGDPIERAVATNFYPGRSGDLIIVLRPYFIFSTSSAGGASHGAGYPYDQNVPLFLFGQGIKAGQTFPPAGRWTSSRRSRFFAGSRCPPATGGCSTKRSCRSPRPAPVRHPR